MRGFKLNIGLDVDEIVYECVSYALDLMNKKYNYSFPITINEVTAWGVTGNRTDVIFECFSNPKFYETQPLIKGAKDFVHKLSKMANVYFVTAIAPEFMGIRVKRLLEDFPEVPKENIIMTSSKNVIDLDVLFDDGSHNILSSISKYPILKRMPWNTDITGVLAVNNYDDFFTVIKEIQKGSFNVVEKPDIIALVGPTGSGKKDIVHELCNLPRYERPVSITTREKSPKEKDGEDYQFVRTDQFVERETNGDFFETTSYAGVRYGTVKKSIQDILDRGNVAVIPIDICGAMTLKRHFPNVLTVFVKRNKRDVLSEIMTRTISNKEKVDRIISMETENKNREICDLVIENSNVCEATEELLKMIEAI